MRVLVIGAGVVGASVAYRLAQGGADVAIVERGRAGGGTSAVSFAWTNSNNKTPRAYHDLNVEGMHAHASLRSEFGTAPWWHGGGNILWAIDDAERAAVQQRIDHLRAWEYAAEEITPARLHDLEPDIPPDAVRGATIAYFPEEGWVETTVYVHAMIQAAVDAGARLHGGTMVREIRRAGDRITGVRTESGDTHHADVVVNCAGPWANDVGASAALSIPLAPTRGLLVTTSSALTRLQRILHAPGCQVRPDGGGRVMVQADDADETVTATGAVEPPADLPPELVRRASRLLPGLAGLAAETARIGTRPMPADGHSVIGPQAGVSGYYVIVTHSGVTLAPFLAAVTAAEFLHGRSDPRLAAFRLDRFSALSEAGSRTTGSQPGSRPRTHKSGGGQRPAHSVN